MRLCIDGRYWQVLKSKVASCSTAAGGYLAKDERLQAHLCCAIGEQKLKR